MAHKMYSTMHSIRTTSTTLCIYLRRYNKIITVDNCLEQPAADIVNIDGTTFDTVFYFGMGMGSVTAGGLAYV